MYKKSVKHWIYQIISHITSSLKIIEKERRKEQKIGCSPPKMPLLNMEIVPTHRRKYYMQSNFPIYSHLFGGFDQVHCKMAQL